MPEQPIDVLLVEDDPTDQLLVKHTLRKSPIRINLHCVESMELAMSPIRNQKLDVVVTDLNLPDCDIQTTIKLMAQINPHIPVIVMSGLADFVIEEQIINAGFNAFVYKGSFANSKLVDHIVSAAKRLPAVKN